MRRRLHRILNEGRVHGSVVPRRLEPQNLPQHLSVNLKIEIYRADNGTFHRSCHTIRKSSHDFRIILKSLRTSVNARNIVYGYGGHMDHPDSTALICLSDAMQEQTRPSVRYLHVSFQPFDSLFTTSGMCVRFRFKFESSILLKYFNFKLLL